MKVAIVSYGHVDSVVPLAKSLSRLVDVDLYLALALNFRKESVLDFSDAEVREGVIDLDSSLGFFDPEVVRYIGDGVNVRFLVYHNLKLRSWKNWMLSFSFSARLRTYDIVHFNGMNATLPQLLFCLPKKKKVFTIHDFKSHTGEERKFPELVNEFLCKSRWQVILQNKSIFRELCDQYSEKREKLNYVPFGCLDIYTGYLSEVVKKERGRKVLFFGRVSPYKGIEYLVEAAKMARDRVPDLKVVLAGGGKYYFDISELERDETFEIVNDYISNKDLVSLIEDAAVVVCPYTDATQSGVVMTAYAFNKPVIATAVGGLPDVVEDGITGRLVPPRNARALADAICDLLLNPGELAKMSLNINRTYSEGGFSWQSIAEKTVAVYKEALS